MRTNYTHPRTGVTVSKAEYFNIMFGKEFMSSNDKGTIEEYVETNINL